MPSPPGRTSLRCRTPDHAHGLYGVCQMTERVEKSELSRRKLLGLGGGIAATAALAPVLASSAPALALPAGAASVPETQYFDLTQPSYDLFRGKTLAAGTVMQSFTFDNVNRRLFVAQLMNGSTSAANGDLAISRLDFSGNLLDHMYLKGFGHGVSIGVEPSGSTSYLWTEVDAAPGAGDGTARGTRLARFAYSAGATYTNTSSQLAKHKPIAGTEQTAAVDPINNRLVVRYRDASGAFRFVIFDLAAAAKGDFSAPLANVATPTGLGTFQGYTLYGSYLYLFTGNAYSSSNPDPGNARLTSIDVNTGTPKQKSVLTKAGASLTYREPEGLAIYRTAGGETRLFLGFASGSAGARKANIFYKNALTS